MQTVKISTGWSHGDLKIRKKDVNFTSEPISRQHHTSSWGSGHETSNRTTILHFINRFLGAEFAMKAEKKSNIHGYTGFRVSQPRGSRIIVPCSTLEQTGVAEEPNTSSGHVPSSSTNTFGNGRPWRKVPKPRSSLFCPGWSVCPVGGFFERVSPRSQLSGSWSKLIIESILSCDSDVVHDASSRVCSCGTPSSVHVRLFSVLQPEELCNKGVISSESSSARKRSFTSKIDVSISCRWWSIPDWKQNRSDCYHYIKTHSTRRAKINRHHSQLAHWWTRERVYLPIGNQRGWNSKSWRTKSENDSAWKSWFPNFS